MRKILSKTSSQFKELAFFLRIPCFQANIGEQDNFKSKIGRKLKETTESERKIIIYLHNQGKSYAEIGEMIDRSRFTISSIVKRFKDATSLENESRTGRPLALIDQGRTQIVRKVQANPKISSTQVAAEVRESFGNGVHPLTIRRVLHEFNYSTRVARRKALISTTNQ